MKILFLIGIGIENKQTQPKKKKIIIGTEHQVSLGTSDETKMYLDMKSCTVQLRVLASRLANAWIQYATSARGLAIDVAPKISEKKYNT
jgi:hypothetical protein